MVIPWATKCCGTRDGWCSARCAPPTLRLGSEAKSWQSFCRRPTSPAPASLPSACAYSSPRPRMGSPESPFRRPRASVCRRSTAPARPSGLKSSSNEPTKHCTRPSRAVAIAWWLGSVLHEHSTSLGEPLFFAQPADQIEEAREVVALGKAPVPRLRRQRFSCATADKHDLGGGQVRANDGC